MPMRSDRAPAAKDGSATASAASVEADCSGKSRVAQLLTGITVAATIMPELLSCTSSLHFATNRPEQRRRHTATGEATLRSQVVFKGLDRRDEF
jgi:hypothetical protein